MLPGTRREALGGNLQQISRVPVQRSSLLRRNLILIASYLVVLSLIAVGYTS